MERFRGDAITSLSRGDARVYFTAYYDARGQIIVARRERDGRWRRRRTGFACPTDDSHNTVSVGIDGHGFVHLAWGSHNGTMCYARSTEPLGLAFVPAQVVGSLEESVTYPQFHRLPSGDLLLLYRNGRSGSGALVVDRLVAGEQRWVRLHDALIDGSGKRSPYWQSCVDARGRLHVSWCWRETSDVETNHDLWYCRAQADDNLSFGEPELVKAIPQGSGLINQTSMTCDDHLNPLIVSWWRQQGVVQYHVLAREDDGWHDYDTHVRSTDFDLTGRGTKRLPCARPAILAGEGQDVFLLTRDQERADHASVCHLRHHTGTLELLGTRDIVSQPLGQWEPLYDVHAWAEERELALFVQRCEHTPDHAGSKATRESPVFVVQARAHDLAQGGE